MWSFLREVIHGSRIRPAVLVAFGAALLAAPSAGAGGQGGFGCSSGADLGGVTFDQMLLLPRIQAGLEAGVYDVAGNATFFATVDKNGDGVICVHTGPVDANANDHLHWLYYYNFVDDNSAASTG